MLIYYRLWYTSKWARPPQRRPRMLIQSIRKLIRGANITDGSFCGDSWSKSRNQTESIFLNSQVQNISQIAL